MRRPKPIQPKRSLTGNHTRAIVPASSARLLFRRVALLAPWCLALAFLALAVVARAAEPGPEADGVYSCGNSTEKEWVYVTNLELKGKTYREFKENVALEKRGEFLPFTTDGKGGIKWSGRFSFLSHVGSVQSSSYSADGPKIFINYSDNKRNPVLMVCGQDSSKDNPKASPKEK